MTNKEMKIKLSTTEHKCVSRCGSRLSKLPKSEFFLNKN